MTWRRGDDEIPARMDVSAQEVRMSMGIVNPVFFQEISNRTHGLRIPKKPEYLIARLQLTERGPLVRSYSIFD